VANACRVNELFAPAEVALDYARSWREDGTHDLMVQVRIDDVEASFLKAERKLKEAEALLDQVYRTYRRIGERHLAGRALVNKGLCRFYAGCSLEAVWDFKQALRLLDAARDPQLVAATQHDLLYAVTEAGNFDEAERLLRESGLRRSFADEPLNLLRLRWLEGKIRAGLGRLAEAECILGEVRAGFLARRLELVAAVAGVDQVKLVLQQGELERAAELGRKLRERAEEKEILPQAYHAILTLEVACRHHVATVRMAELVGRFLDRLQHDRHLKWHPELMLIG
jgi:tetratricopeptide (TPR) repeat protein